MAEGGISSEMSVNEVKQTAELGFAALNMVHHRVEDQSPTGAPYDQKYFKPENFPQSLADTILRARAMPKSFDLEVVRGVTSTMLIEAATQVCESPNIPTSLNESRNNLDEMLSIFSSARKLKNTMIQQNQQDTLLVAARNVLSRREYSGVFPNNKEWSNERVLQWTDTMYNDAQQRIDTQLTNFRRLT